MWYETKENSNLGDMELITSYEDNNSLTTLETYTFTKSYKNVVIVLTSFNTGNNCGGEVNPTLSNGSVTVIYDENGVNVGSNYYTKIIKILKNVKAGDSFSYKVYGYNPRMFAIGC